MRANEEERIEVRELPGSKEIYMVREEGYFPVLTCLSEREIVAVLRGGAGHIGINGRLDLVRSVDGGESWLPPVVVVDSDRDDRNPALGVSPHGILVLAYHVQGNYDSQGRYKLGVGRVDTYQTRSHDGGRTWENPHPLSYTSLNGRSPFGKIVTLPNGTMLMPIYGKRTGVVPGEQEFRSKTGSYSYILRSRDEGVSWGDPSVVAPDFNEAAFLRLPNGELLSVLRSEDRKRHPKDLLYSCRSEDDGYTWTKPVRITEPAEHPADLTLLSNGYVLLTYGHRHPPFGVQGMISRDSGHTWDHKHKLVYADDRPGGDCGYPSTVRLPSGKLITAYYSAGDHMDAYRGDGAFAMAVSYDENELLKALGK